MKAATRALITAVALFAVVLAVRGYIPNVPTGTWASAGAMSAARNGASATLLPDGRILIAGGSASDGSALASAELYNPDGSFSAAASMHEARSGHAAIMLADGRVLVSGGHTASGGITNSAETYDPLTNAWQTLASAMVDARAGHSASQLLDGSVLLAGGENSSGPVASLEVFDLTQDSFHFVSSLSNARKDHAAAVLQDGRVVIIGGNGLGADGNPAALASSEIYDPLSSSVSAGPSLASARARHSATTLLDGKVWVAGGNDGANDLASAEIYDPAAGAFSAASAAMSVARSGHSAFLLPNNNSVLIVGGSSAGSALASAELYIPWTGVFQATGSMVSARAGLAGSALQADGLLLAAGGSASASAELYGFATVKTDRSDYVPGEVVTITGSGWQPGETVTLTLAESPNLDTHPPLMAIADASGHIFNNQFSPDLHDLNIRFYLTATGSSSQAQNTFTDAGDSVSVVVSCSPNPVTVNTATTCTATVTNVEAGAPHGWPQGEVTFQFTGTGTAGTFSGNPCTTARIGLTNNSSCSVTLTPTAVVSGKVKGNFNAANNDWKNDTSPQIDLTVNAPSCSAPSVSTQPIGSNITYGASTSFTAAASGSPAPSVQWQVSTNGGGSWSNLSDGGVYSGSTTGTLSLTVPPVSLSGNQYRAVFTNSCTPSTANSNGATLTVSKKDATWTTNPNSKTYGDADPSPLTTGSGSGFLVSDGVSASYSRVAGENVAGSPYHITAALSASVAGALDNYNITNNGANFTINKKDATWTTNPNSKTYGDADPSPLTTGASAASPNNFLAADNVTATYSRAVGETVAGSPYHITANLSAAAGVLDNYNITNAGADFTINRRNATWTTNPNSKTYGDADPVPLTTGASAAAPNNFIASDNVTASYSRAAGETVAGGPYHITATLSPAGVLDNYNVTNAGADFTINKRNATWVTNAASKTYGDADPSPLTTGASAASPNNFLAADNVTATYSRAVGETVAGSPYHITANLSAAAGVLDNYNITNAGADFTINRAHLTVTADNKSKVYDGFVYSPFTATITGFKNGETLATSGVTGSPAFSGAAVTAIYPGTYTITPGSGSLSAANYDFTSFVNGTLTISYGACAAGYGPGGVILPPINSDGTSVYPRKGGSTIPVKFTVCDAFGNPISNSAAVFGPNGASELTMLNAVRGTISTANEDGTYDIPDAAFRWTGGQWIFNMATTNLTAGQTYTFRINLAYGSITFVVGVK